VPDGEGAVGGGNGGGMAALRTAGTVKNCTGRPRGEMQHGGGANWEEEAEERRLTSLPKAGNRAGNWSSHGERKTEDDGGTRLL
jgi:hypothetical protein